MTAKALPPSLWAATAAPGPDCPPLAGAAEAEVAVVGGGFTGLSAALHLAEAGHSVTLLEAAQPGWGASGRNGGQVNPGWRVLPEAMEARFGAARFGAERGRRVVAMAGAACDLVFALIERHGIACEAVRPGYVQGAVGRYGLAAVEAWVRQWSALGAPVEPLDRAGIAALLGTPAYCGGLLDRRGGSLQPLSYARGLARAARAAGATLHGGSPATGLERRGAAWRLTTPSGSLEAKSLLLCTNGYSDRLWPGLARCVVPVASVIAASEPLGADRRAAVLPGGHAVSEARRVGVYYKLDGEGRFVIGGRGPTGRPEPLTERDLEPLVATALRLFPQLSGLAWTHRWGGFVAMTADSAPRLLRLGEGAWAGLGYNGRGVAMATMMGRQLALAVRGEEPDMPIEAPAPLPLHGFRDIAVAGRVLLGRWLDRLERAA